MNVKAELIECCRANVPQSLRDLPAWLLWARKKGDDGRDKKIPIYADGANRSGKLDTPLDRSKLVTFEEAAQALARVSRAVGFGLALGRVPSADIVLSGLDFDGCYEGDELDERVVKIVKAADSYTERSPSGTGLHVLGTGDVGTTKKDGHGFEIYSGRRFFTVTGHRVNGANVADLTEAATLTRALFGASIDESNTDTDTDAEADESDDNGEIREHARNETLSRLAFKLRKAGLNVEEIAEALLARNATRCRPPLPESEVRAIAEGKRRIDPDERPAVELVAGNLHDSVREAVRLIAPDAFARGGRLIYLGHPADIAPPSADGTCIDTRTSLVRPATATVALPLRSGRVRVLLAARSRCMRFDARTKRLKSVDWPREIAEVIAESADWPGIRPLTAIVDAPTLRPDMSSIDAPGYDPQTGIHYAPSGEFPPVPIAPTRDDAVAALARLDELLAEFPFQTPDARAVALAHILTAAVRPLLSTVPVFFYSASMAGSGKTLIARIPALIAHSGLPAERPWPGKHDDEVRKVLGAVARLGDAELRFDNAPNAAQINSPALCGFATAEVWTDRMLGSSDSITAPNKCTVSVTGNNIAPAGDLARRSLICRLELAAESPRGRTFRIPDLPAYVRAHRPSLLIDALTVIRAYALAGRPVKVEPLPSFEQWSRTVRDALLWLGCGDPVATQAEAEDGLAELRTAFEALHTRFEGEWFSAAQVAAAAGPVRLSGNPETLLDATMSDEPSLAAVMQEAGCTRPADLRSAGYWLRMHKGRVAGGLQLVKSTGGRHGQWRLRSL